jgi:hypothetical protein
MHGLLPRLAHREHGFGYCSVALHRAFIWRQRVHEQAPRTERLFTTSFVWMTVGFFMSPYSIAFEVLGLEKDMVRREGWMPRLRGKTKGVLRGEDKVC